MRDFSTEPGFRQSVELMFNRAAALSVLYFLFIAVLIVLYMRVFATQEKE